MGGDDSQKLLPWRGIISLPGPEPPAHYEINTVTDNRCRLLVGLTSRTVLSYRLPGSFLASRGGSLFQSAEGMKRSVWPPSSESLQLLLTRCKHHHSGRFVKGRASDVYRQQACRNQRIDLIARCNALRRVEQRLQRKPRGGEGVPQQSLPNP